MGNLDVQMVQTASALASDGLVENYTDLPFSTDQGLGARATLGLVVLSSDQTIEPEVYNLTCGEGIVVHHARIENDVTVTPETLAAMEARLPQTAALLPKGFGFDVIGYGCTSASLIIGEDKVADGIHQAHPGVATTNPVTAVRAAMAALGMRRIALLTPYIAEINHRLRDQFQSLGFSIPVMGTFNEKNDLVVGRIDRTSLIDAIVKLGSHNSCDGVFISCTGLRVAYLVKEAEERLGKPVTSSNHALAWHMLRLAGVNDPKPEHGSLFACRMG